MKKSIIAISALLLTTAAVSAQSVKILKGGNVIATYSLSDIDQVLFSPQDVATETPAEAVAGNYSTYRQVTLPAMASMGVLVEGNETVTIDATGDNAVSVGLPSCEYTMGTGTFNLPAVTVEGVNVTEENGVYTLAGKFEGAIGDKSTTVDFSGTVNADGTFELVQDMKYGAMPMVLHMVYSPAK